MPSGRRAETYLEKQTKQKLIRLSTANLLRYIRDPKSDPKVKVMICKDIVLRQIPNVTEEIGNTSTQTIIQFIRDNGTTTSTRLDTCDNPGQITEQ